MNKLIIIGNLTGDPVVVDREINGQPVKVCNFSVAVNQGYGDNQKTTYFRIQAWRNLAESCGRYLSKGKKVMVSGPVSARTYQGNDGNTYVSMDVNANEVEFLSPSDRNNSEAPAAAVPNYDAPVAAPVMQVVETDELPF